MFFFPVAREPAVLRLRDGSTLSVIYSVGLARIQCCDNRLFYIMFAVVLVRFVFFACLLWIRVAIYLGAVFLLFFVVFSFCFTSCGRKKLFMLFTPICLSGHIVVWTVWAMRRGLLLCATRYLKKICRGPIEQCAGDFCSLLRGGMIGKKRKIGRGLIERWVGKFHPVPRDCVKENKKEKSVGIQVQSAEAALYIVC